MLLKFAVAVLIVWLLLRKADVRKEDFLGVSLRWIAAAFAVIFLQSLLTAVRWLYLMRAVNCKVTLFEAVSLTMQGLFFTLFIPGGAVSGDVCKAALIAGKTADGGKFQAAFSVLIDRVCGLCGLLIISFCSALAAMILLPEAAPWFRKLMATALIAIPLLLLCALMAFRCDLILKIAFFKKLYDWSNKITRGAVARIEEALAAYRPAWKSVLGCTLFSAFVTFPLVALSVWLICIGLPGCDAWNNLYCAVGSMLSGSLGELAGILPLTPGGIGVRDAAFVEIFKGCGMSEAVSTQIPLLFTTLFMLTNSLGGLFALYMLLGKWSKK